MDEIYSFIDKRDAVPSGADFCLILSDDSMEPYFARGDRVFVIRREVPAEMEAGIFYYNGRVCCRQFCEDYAGNMHLLCANPERERENLCLDKAERQRCICLGKVLTEKKLPRPVYI